MSATKEEMTGYRVALTLEDPQGLTSWLWSELDIAEVDGLNLESRLVQTVPAGTACRVDLDDDRIFVAEFGIDQGTEAVLCRRALAALEADLEREMWSWRAKPRTLDLEQGGYVYMEGQAHGMYEVLQRDVDGEVVYRVRFDNYHDARSDFLRLADAEE